MKKCSTAALALAAALVAPARAGDACAFQPTAPDTHVVVRGDTLWDLASTFLNDPWCWPQVWALNRESIDNPHRIFPGQTVVLGRERGQHGIAARNGAESASVMLSPSARPEQMPDPNPIPVIDPQLLNQAAQLRLAHPGAAAGAARIVGFSESRRIASQTDVALVEGPLPTGRLEVIRRLPAVLDPDSGESLGVPLLHVGSARLLGPAPSGLYRAVVESSASELLAGDLLLPAAPERQTTPPAMAAPAIEGKVAAVLGGQRWAAQRDIVAINRGSRDGLEAGSMVAVFAHVRIGADDSRQAPSSQRIAQLLVFQVLDRMALALVTRSSDVFGTGAAVGPIGGLDGQR